jgi:hypothetical protein
MLSPDSSLLTERRLIHSLSPDVDRIPPKQMQAYFAKISAGVRGMSEGGESTEAGSLGKSLTVGNVGPPAVHQKTQAGMTPKAILRLTGNKNRASREKTVIAAPKTKFVK